jgi:hypothetical protein
MKNLYVVAMLTAALAGGTLESASAQSASKTGIKNVVLVHGAFADGSGWEAVADILKKDGYTVSVVRHPETSYAEDIKFTKAVIDRQSSDRSINPEQERMMAKRAHAKTIEVNSSHVAYMSHPKETAKLIEEAATSASANQ